MLSCRKWQGFSDFSVEEPVEDKVIGLGWLKLGCHVTSAVDSAESQAALVRFPVARDLALNHVLFPLAGLVPVE